MSKLINKPVAASLSIVPFSTHRYESSSEDVDEATDQKTIPKKQCFKTRLVAVREDNHAVTHAALKSVVDTLRNEFSTAYVQLVHLNLYIIISDIVTDYTPPMWPNKRPKFWNIV